MKGLDAFKWAILKGKKIGVTTHYVSEKADEGKLIESGYAYLDKATDTLTL